MELTPELKTRGRERFLAAHPDAQQQVDALTDGIAKALGVPLEELKYVETHKALQAKAQAAGEDGFEYFLRYVCDNETERQLLIQKYRENEQRTLGLIW